MTPLSLSIPSQETWRFYATQPPETQRPAKFKNPEDFPNIFRKQPRYFIDYSTALRLSKIFALVHIYGFGAL